MVREFTLGIRLNEKELDDLKARAEEHHLKLSSYCRWFLFNAGLFVQSKGEGIVRISSGIPKRIMTEHKIKEINTKKEVMQELKEEFEKGIKLRKITWQDQVAVKNNRNLRPKITLEELKMKKLHPPKVVNE